MKNLNSWGWFLAIFPIIVLVFLLVYFKDSNMNKDVDMKIASSAFSEGGRIPTLFTCDGENIQPAMSVSGVPQEAKSLALIFEDPDVPKDRIPDGLFVHMVRFNIDPKSFDVAQGGQFPGTRGSATNGSLDYIGPCPPDREHRYFFKLYALDSILDLKEGASRDDLIKAMEGHIIKESVLMGLFERTPSATPKN